MKLLKYSLVFALAATLFACAKEEDSTDTLPTNPGNGLNDGTLELRATGDTTFNLSLTANYLRLGDTSITVSFTNGSTINGNFTVLGDLLNVSNFPHADSSGVSEPPAYLFAFNLNGKPYLGTAGTLSKSSLSQRNFVGTIRNQRCISFTSASAFETINVEVDFNAASFF